MEQQSVRPKPAEFATAEDAIINVIVGPKKQHFYLHRTLICSESPFFRGCLDGKNFKEGNMCEVNLPEDDAAAFAVLVNCMYRNRPFFLNNAKEEVNAIRAYLLADKFLMTAYKNTIMDAIMRKGYIRDFNTEVFPHFKPEDFRMELHIWRFYIRSAAIDVYHDRDKGLHGSQEDLFREGGDFAVQVVKEIVRLADHRKDFPDDFMDFDCEYHDHSDGTKDSCDIYPAVIRDDDPGKIDDDYSDDQET